MKLNTYNRSSFLPIYSVGTGLRFANFQETEGIKVSVSGRHQTKKQRSKGRRGQG